MQQNPRTKVGAKSLTYAPGLRDVGIRKGRAGPLGEAGREGLAFLDVSEDLLVLENEGFVDKDILVDELVFLRCRLVLRGLGQRGLLRRRRPFPSAAAVAHGWVCVRKREIGGKGQ